MMRPGPGTWSPLVPPRVSATLSAMLTGDTDKDTGYEAWDYLTKCDVMIRINKNN